MDRFSAEGYIPFNRPEIDIMIHPAFSFDEADSKSDELSTLYRFIDYNAEYMIFDIRVLKNLPSGGYLDHDTATSILTKIVANTKDLSNLSFVAVDDTSMGGNHGVIVRHSFDVSGEPGYGVFMMIDYGTWLYAFDIYGRDFDYPTIEDLLKSVFSTAYLHGPFDRT